MNTSLDDDIARFVVQLLATGRMLVGLIADISESLPPDAYPGEATHAVAIEMLYGTIRTALEDADPRDVRQATKLIDQAGERTVEHLRLALSLSQQMRSGRAGQGRNYG